MFAWEFVPPMRSTTFVARRPGPFSAFVQTAEIGGLHLEPLPPVRVTDWYYDTDTGDLLRRALALRVREQGSRRTVGLRALETPGPLPGDLDLPSDFDDPSDARLVLPSGALADAVEAITGPAPLGPLLSLRQYRTPRVARDGDQAVGMLSFDVVVCEAPGARMVSNEVEVEVHRAAALARLAAVLEAQGLEPAERSTFVRSVLRLTRTLGQPVLLLPDEVRELERASASGDLRQRRRASVILLDARGVGPETIAAQTGMSVPRVLHWQRRFREVRLDALDRESSAIGRRSVLRPTTAHLLDTPTPRPALDMASSASAPPSSERPLTAFPRRRVVRRASQPEAPPATSGDGMPAADPTGVTDMVELLDLFAPSYPDTPHLGDMSAPDPVADDLADDDLADDDLAGDDEPGGDLLVARPPAERARAVVERVSATDEETPGPGRSGARFPSPRLNPYPVVLGPVRTAREGASLDPPQTRTAERSSAPSQDAVATSPVRDPFAEVDLRALRRDGPAPSSAGTAGARPGRLAALATAPSASNGEAPSLALYPSTPLLEAARLSLADHLDEFDVHADGFLRSRAPSAARRLLIAIHRLRLAAETFGPALPSQTGRQIAAGLRPLAERLAAALDAAGAAALAPERRGLAHDAVARLNAAAVHLDSLRQSDWRPRAHRLLAHLESQHQAGLPTSDFAQPAPDDLVGQPGDAPAPTRLHHVLGSAVWKRFEALRAFEDDLAQPTTDLAAHLAVALSSLRFVVRLADPAATDIAAALDAAEREVTRTRHHAAETLPGSDLSVVPQVWAEIVARPFRERLAAVVAGI